MLVLRAGQRQIQLPGIGVRISQKRTGGDAWWLSGGVAAANCVAAYQPKGAASLAASYTNLANPGTYNAAPGGAPAFDATTGWKSDGSSVYLTTGITPSSGWSMIARFSGVVGTGGNLIASYSGVEGTRFVIVPYNGDNKVYYQNGSYLGVSPGTTSGVLAVAGQQGYRNGSADGGTIGAWSGTATQAIQIFRAPIGSPLYINCYLQAVAIYSTILTGSQVAAISTAMAAL